MVLGAHQICHRWKMTMFTAILCFHFVHVLSCSIFTFKKTHVITQTRDIVRGVLVGNEAKEAKIQKYKTTYM